MRLSKKQGFFIALEGGEGSGKSSSIEIIKNKIESYNFQVTTTREPGGTPSAEKIRNIIVAGDASFEPLTDVLLFAAARKENVEKIIKPALEKGHVVICDRYILSTLAYQCKASNVDEKIVIDIHQKTVDGLMPDLTIILDVDPKDGLMRSCKRLTEENSNEDRYENLDLDFHHKVRDAMVNYNLSPHIIIDANQSKENVQKEIEKVISNYFGKNHEN